jgi:valyl-tRNA synthetase
MSRIFDFIVAVRARRKEVGVPDKQPVLIFAAWDAGSSIGSRIPSISNVYVENFTITNKLANVSAIESKTFEYLESTPELGWTQAGGPFVSVVYEKQIDVPAERERLTKDIAKYEKGLAAAERQLGNEGFLAKAPAQVVEGLKKQEAETRLLLEKARAALNSLPR